MITSSQLPTSNFRGKGVGVWERKTSKDWMRIEAMNPIVKVGTASTPSGVLKTVAEVVDPVERVPTVQGGGVWEARIPQ